MRSLPSAQLSQPGRRTSTSTETCSPGASFCSGVRRPSCTAIGTRRPSGPKAWTCSIVPPNGCTVTCASAVESPASVTPEKANTATITSTTITPITHHHPEQHAFPAMPSRHSVTMSRHRHPWIVGRIQEGRRIRQRSCGSPMPRPWRPSDFGCRPRRKSLSALPSAAGVASLSVPRSSRAPARARGTSARRPADPRSRTGRRRARARARRRRERPRPEGPRGRSPWWPRGRASGPPPGPARRRARPRRSPRREDPVDDVPALERGGVVERAGHHELARPRRTGALGQALGAAHRRGQADDGLDQAEARGLGREQQVAAERELERRRQAERVRGEDCRQR